MIDGAGPNTHQDLSETWPCIRYFPILDHIQVTVFFEMKSFHSENLLVYPISFKFVIEYSSLRNTLLFQQVNAGLHHSRRTTNISINRISLFDSRR
jgi:hypothetical protein